MTGEFGEDPICTDCYEGKNNSFDTKRQTDSDECVIF